MKRMNRFVAVGLCAGLTLSLLTGCAATPKKLDANATVATLGDEKLSLGVADFIFRITQTQTGGYLRMFLGDDGSNLWEQDLVGNGTPYGMTVKDSALEEYKEMVILEQHMGEYGVEITDDDKAAITAAATQFLADNEERTLDAMCATQDTVERFLTLYTIENRMTKAIEESADITITDEEAAQKRVRYAYFAVPQPEVTEEETELAAEKETEAATETATETASEAAEDETEAVADETPERAATREAVQALIDEIKSGKDMEEVVKAYDETKNVVENTYGEGSATISETITAAADTLTEEGEVFATPVESENGFYIVQMVSLFDEEATEEAKEDMLSDRQREYYNEVVDGWNTEELKVDSKVWDTVNFADDFRTPAVEEEEAVAVEEETEAESETEAASEATETETEAASETAETETETAAESES